MEVKMRRWVVQANDHNQRHDNLTTNARGEQERENKKGGEHQERMNNNFEEMIERQVEQFNNRVEESANFHQEMLKLLCVERMMRDYEAIREQPVEEGVSQPSGLVHSVVRSVGRVGSAGKGVVARVLSQQRRHPHPAKEHPTIIEGEYVVIHQESDEVRKHRYNQ